MSCDRNRERLFSSIAHRIAPAIGTVAAARDFLDTLFDVVSSQEAPRSPVLRLSGEARTRQMMKLAEREGIDLYPHPSKTGLPEPEAQQGWRVVAEVLEAVEQGRAMPEEAQDAQQVAAFQVVAKRSGRTYWATPVSGVALRRLREGWAAELGRVEALWVAPQLLGEEEHAPWLREQTEQIADDSLIPAHLSAAARHYLALDEAGALDRGERARWAGVLAGVAGIGVGMGRRDDQTVCGACGLYADLSKHRCNGTDADLGARVSMAVAEALADPLYSGFTPDPSPFETAERLLDGWMQTGQPDPPEGVTGRLLDAMRAADVRMIQRLDALPYRSGPVPQADLDMRWLRDATIRTPIVFEGQRLIWEAGYLYPETAYRAGADWSKRGEPGVTKLVPMRPDTHDDHVVALLQASWLAHMMGGATVHAQFFQLRRRLWPRYFETDPVRVRELKVDDLTAESCGCIYSCVDRPNKGNGQVGRRKRLHEPPGGCATHLLFDPLPADDKRSFARINLKKPRFQMPVWPGAEQVRGEGEELNNEL